MTGLLPNSDIHGTLVQVHGQGLLISGPPGSGKSRLAWELLLLGHRLVVDDSPLLTRTDNHLQGQCRPGFEALLYLEPEGLIDVRQGLTTAAFVTQNRIDGILMLGNQAPLNSVEIMGLSIPAWPLPTLHAKALAALVEQGLGQELHLPVQCL